MVGGCWLEAPRCLSHICHRGRALTKMTTLAQKERPRRSSNLAEKGPNRQYDWKFWTFHKSNSWKEDDLEGFDVSDILGDDEFETYNHKNVEDKDCPKGCDCNSDVVDCSDAADMDVGKAFTYIPQFRTWKWDTKIKDPLPDWKFKIIEWLYYWHYYFSILF